MHNFHIVPELHITSDDGSLVAVLGGWCGNSRDMYRVYIYQSSNIKTGPYLIGKRFFRLDEAEDWLLDKLECPIVTILQGKTRV